MIRLLIRLLFDRDVETRVRVVHERGGDVRRRDDCQRVAEYFERFYAEDRKW